MIHCDVASSSMMKESPTILGRCTQSRTLNGMSNFGVIGATANKQSCAIISCDMCAKHILAMHDIRREELRKGLFRYVIFFPRSTPDVNCLPLSLQVTTALLLTRGGLERVLHRLICSRRKRDKHPDSVSCLAMSIGPHLHQIQNRSYPQVLYL